MSEEITDKNKIIAYWIESSDGNYKTMEHLLSSRDYHWALFMGHLVIEKLLKAVYVKTLGEHAVFTHDLLRLANKCKLELTKEQEDWLDRITTFNINARYDDYKKSFYILCTSEFTSGWIDKIKQLRSWLKEKL